jgi:cbb3-type cytochrome oxidase maturation protein
MYFPYFIAYILAGFVIALAALFWALTSGQFRDQRRARFIPLVDDPGPPPARITRFNRIEAYLLGGIVLAGLAASAALLIYSLVHGG